MIRVPVTALFLLPILSPCFAADGGIHRSVARPMPENESVGERPYEMVWANREQPREPLADFNSLEGWTVEGLGGAVAEMYESQRQRVWESPVARLVYRGESADSHVVIRPPERIAIRKPVSAVTLWMYGNNWGWVPDPTTPRVDVVLLMEDGAGGGIELPLTNVRWKEWWLIHKVLPPGILEEGALYFSGLRIEGCANAEDRELYFEDLSFFQESHDPIEFEPRPKRGIDPFPGQPEGANTGPGRLPFPTREETILPSNFESDYTNSLELEGGTYVFRYRGADAEVEYRVSPDSPWFRVIECRLNGVSAGTLWNEAGPEFEKPPKQIRPSRESAVRGGVLNAAWTAVLDGGAAETEMNARLWGKSLVLDVFVPGGEATGLSYGHFAGVAEPALIQIPYLNYGGHHLNVLMSKGREPFFASVWMDWYRSNGSKPHAEDKIEGGRVRLNGGVRYLPKTDGKRNGLFERVFVTVSPVFEETLPTIANPPAKQGKLAGSRLWQESWGPSDYATEMARSRRLREHGIEMLTQCNHEITWRDGGESFTFRTKAAPGKGGDEALKQYVAHQKSLGWRSGLYTNYCDFTPVNEHWNTDRVMRTPDNNLVTAWPRCYSPKALYAVEKDRELAPAIQAKFGTNAAYTDVHTAVAPWDRCDFDSRVPGAGTFAATFYAYGELLLHDQDAYDGHCWSEGHHQWLYAGLCTGNYGLTYSGLRLWEYPYLPHFDLLKMHPLSVDMGVPWTARFFEGKEGWSAPENIERSIDQFIAATLAYGHIGWLVEEAHGIRQTRRSYFLLQPVQSRYALEPVDAILYGRGEGLIPSPDALLNGAWRENRLYTRYANGVETWINGNADRDWAVTAGGREYVLPPYGWVALENGNFVAGSYSVDGGRMDRAVTENCVFLDGRGRMRRFGGVATDGSVAVILDEEKRGLTLTAAGGTRAILTPEADEGTGGVRARIAAFARLNGVNVEAFGAGGERLGAEQITPSPSSNVLGLEIPLRDNAVRYEITPLDR